MIAIFNLENHAAKLFEHYVKKNQITIKANIDFYNDYFTFSNENSISKRNYSDISKCIETNTNFYFKFSSTKTIITIKKNNCEKNL